MIPLAKLCFVDWPADARVVATASLFSAPCPARWPSGFCAGAGGLKPAHEGLDEKGGERIERTRRVARRTGRRFSQRIAARGAERALAAGARGPHRCLARRG